MATFSHGSSQFALHLADRALTPILSSSRQTPSSSPAQSRSQAQALSSLTTTALAAFESASRLGLGIPERIMIETQSSGPLLLHSYLNPQSIQRPRSRRAQSRETANSAVERTGLILGENTARGSAGDQDHEVLVNGTFDGEDENTDEAQPPPLIVASVVAPSASDRVEARRAAARLESTARNFQREWIRDQEDSRHRTALPDEEGG